MNWPWKDCLPRKGILAVRGMAGTESGFSQNIESGKGHGEMDALNATPLPWIFSKISLHHPVDHFHKRSWQPNSAERLGYLANVDVVNFPPTLCFFAMPNSILDLVLTGGRLQNVVVLLPHVVTLAQIVAWSMYCTGMLSRT
jgi:hypothetical protein